MKFLKEKGPRILAYIVEILIGVLLIVEPLKFTQIVIIAAGAGILLYGAYDAFKYFKTEALAAAAEKRLYIGLILMLAGAFCMVRSEWLSETFPVLSIIYGLAILLAGLSKVQWTVDVFRLKSGNFIVTGVSALLTVICAVIILVNPFASEKVLWLFAGISLIVEACIDIATLFLKGNREKDIGEFLDED